MPVQFLTFPSANLQGVLELNDNSPDAYSSSVSISWSSPLPVHALLLMQIQEVEFDNNFVTFNVPETPEDEAEVAELDTDRAQSRLAVPNEADFLGRILPSATTRNPDADHLNWSTAIFPITVRPGNHRVGVHSRNSDGKPFGSRDHFSVARAVLVY
jgi:hypothetical protein